MQQRLALPLAAGQFAGLAIALYLPHVAADRLPALDLAAIFVGHAAAQVIAAIPLEPAARIVRMDPALLAPDGQRLAGVDAVEIQFGVALAFRQLGLGKPARGKF